MPLSALKDRTSFWVPELPLCPHSFGPRNVNQPWCCYWDTTLIFAVSQHLVHMFVKSLFIKLFLIILIWMCHLFPPGTLTGAPLYTCAEKIYPLPSRLTIANSLVCILPNTEHVCNLYSTKTCRYNRNYIF